jgi:hypothetical protein
MKPTLKTFATSTAMLFTFALFAIAAPAVQADDYCITNGAQAAHGCGYPNMEACRAASNGIGGTCAPAPSSSNPSLAPSANKPSSALAYEPRQPHLRSKLHPRK